MRDGRWSISLLGAYHWLMVVACGPLQGGCPAHQKTRLPSTAVLLSLIKKNTGIMIKTWKRNKHQLLQKTRILDVCEATDVSPYTDKVHDFVFIDCPGWVNLVPVTEQDEIVMIRQYRHGSQRVTLEIPGGMVDAGEEPITAAARECHEETGYAPHTVHSLGELNPNPALFNNTLHTFYARVSQAKATAHVSETEKTEVALIPIHRLKALLLDGSIDHALVCATLWRFLDQVHAMAGNQHRFIGL
jgi:ADP-ribose pyrophosphatase